MDTEVMVDEEINLEISEEEMDYFLLGEEEDRITENNDEEYVRYVPLNDYDYSFLPTPPALWVKGIDVILN